MTQLFVAQRALLLSQLRQNSSSVEEDRRTAHVATIERIYRMDLWQDFIDQSNRLPGHSPAEARAYWEKIDRLPYQQRKKAHDRAYKKGVDRAPFGTFGFRYISKRDVSDHVWFRDQALGTWRYWIISGTGCVHETFHLTPPPTIQLAWESQLKTRGHPGLDLRTQPAFHLTKYGVVHVREMPLAIITDHETWISTEPLKTQDVDEAVSKHFRIPLKRIVDPCLVVEISDAILKLRIGRPLYDPFSPLGFPVDYTEGYEEYEDEDEAGDKYDDEFGHLMWGMACWDWVFSDFDFNLNPYGPVGDYFFQQNGDIYTLTLKKPEGLSQEDDAAWHADVPYGPFASFARAVEATFWPPTPPAALNSSGIPRSSRRSQRSSKSPTYIYPNSPFPLASVPITRYKYGKPWDSKKVSHPAVHFGVSTPALGDIATHSNVALPAQPSPPPVIRSARSPRSNRRTASTMNSPSQLR
ncbi:hypothetical protein KCU62_g7003, partial [Aureobasidium sp. EXF-3399]